MKVVNLEASFAAFGEPCEVLLIEPAGTLNTDAAGGPGATAGTWICDGALREGKSVAMPRQTTRQTVLPAAVLPQIEVLPLAQRRSLR